MLDVRLTVPKYGLNSVHFFGNVNFLYVKGFEFKDEIDRRIR